MYGWLNVGSLLLGLAALIPPVIIIVRYKRRGNRNQPVLYTTSMCACDYFVSVFRYATMTIWLKLKTGRHSSDTSGGGKVSGALNLLLGTILFNVIALAGICYGKKADRK